MKDWKVRAGTSLDVDAMYQLDLLCFAEPFRFNKKSMRRFATQQNGIAIIAESEEANSIAGFIILNLKSVHGVKLAYVTTLDVHPRQRRKGIAASLMAESERRAFTAGALWGALHVFAGNESAISFYGRCGYVRGLLEPDFYGPGLDAWNFRKRLAK